MASGYKSTGHIISSSFSASSAKLGENPRRTIIGFSSDNPIDRRPIKWTVDRMQEMRNFFDGKSYPYRYADFSSTYETWGRELQLFALALDANHEIGGFIPNEDLIFYSSTGSEYSRALKNFRQDCFLKKISAVSFKQESYLKYKEYGLDYIPDIDFIDRIFPYRFCIFWEEDCDDTDWYKIPVHVKETYVNRFRETLKLLLKDIETIDFDPRFEILNELSKSKSVGDTKRIPLVLRPYRGNKIENYFSTSFSPAERAVVPVYPMGYRDTIITTPEDSSTIRLIERVVTKILESLPYHLYGKSPVEMFNELNNKINSGLNTFICRDIAKEGITKPRYLLSICLEELSKVAPILKDYIRFYDSFSIKGLETLRGHGLGMANALTTVIQLTISAMINQDLSDCGFDCSEIQYYSYNDDFCCILPDELLDEYWEKEGEIFKGLSLIRREEKSFYSRKGLVFCEIYLLRENRLFSEKKLSLRRTVLLSFAFDFIYEAKEYVASLSGEYDETLREFMEEILIFWGWEFFPDEFKYPFSFGGWRSEKFLGYNVDLKFLDDLEYDARIYGAYKACKLQPKIYRRKDRKKFSSIWNRLVIPDENLRRCCPVGNDEEISNKYRIYHQFKEQAGKCRRQHQLNRLDTYHKCRKLELPYEEFIKIVMEDDKFLPPERYIEWIPYDILIPFIKDPYIQDTPLRNYLTFKCEKFCFPLSNNPEDYSIKSYDVKVLRPDSWNVETFFKGKYYLNELEYLPINSEQFAIDDKEFRDLPNRIIAACKMYNNDCYPKFLVQRNKEIGESKLRVYGDMLSVQEQVDIYLGLIRKSALREIISDANYINSHADEISDIDEFLSSKIEVIPSCRCSEHSSEVSEGELEVESRMKSVHEMIAEYFSGRELKDEFPSDEDIYQFVFTKEESDRLEYSPGIQEACLRVRELVTLYYYGNKSHGSRDEFMRTCVLSKRVESSYTITLLGLLGKEGYFGDLIRLFDIDVQEEDIDMDCGDLFAS